MENIQSRSRSFNLRVPLLLSFIISDVAADNYVFRHLHDSSTGYIWAILGFLLLEIIAAPIQSGFSDFTYRKKSLIVALSSTIVSLLCVFLFHQNLLVMWLTILLIYISKACLGNTTPMSWAGIADTQTRNFRFSLGLSTGAFAFGYFLLILINKVFGVADSSLVLIGIFVILIILCKKYFFDFADIPRTAKESSEVPKTGRLHHLMIREFILIFHELRQGRTRLALITFFLWEISLYSIHMLDVDFHLPQFANLTTAMVLGYFLGVAILKLLEKIADKNMIRLGYWVCILSVFIVIIFYFIFGYSRVFVLSCYFFYNLGTAFLAPSLFAILSKERKPHEQGKIYGLIDSTDTVAFLLSAIAVITYNYLRLSPIYIISFSFIVFVVSWLPYARFEKIPRVSRASS